MGNSNKTRPIGFYRALRPLLFLLPPEQAHGLAEWALASGLWPNPNGHDDPRLEIAIAGLHFRNPIGLAAGFDKNGRVAGRAFALGFGFTEIGSVTPRAQPGNPRPRLFRSPSDGAIVNRMGFNSEGAPAVRARLARGATSGHRASAFPLGINLGKNKESEDALADYATGIAQLAEFADYLVFNVSSPNTPGLRTLQNPQTIADLAQSAKAALSRLGISRPLFLKIAPDLTEEDLSAVGKACIHSFDALIVGNTTIARPPGLSADLAKEVGGLSGLPLMPISTTILSRLYRITEGKIPLIGVGGIADGEDAYAKIRAGASLVQVYSALVFRGPGLVRQIKAEMLAALERDGFGHLRDAIGADHRNR